MREVAFIKQNKEKWLSFEKAIVNNDFDNPDELASQYIHVINDLAYAQTYYPKSKVIAYLNQLSANAYQKIYKTKSTDTNRIIEFWKTEVPLICYQYRKFIYIAFIIFSVFTFIGAISAANDGEFVRSVLGDNYVNMSLENIEAGDPVAVYKSGSNWGSFIGITINNLRVGIIAFVLGVFLGIGTLYIMFKNCIMLGSFQYFFYDKGVFWESVRGIWIHGAMEIFAIVIECAAGLILGASILFPATHSRYTSFKLGAKTGIKILISTFPFTFAAGFLEGFITRYSNIMPHWLSVAIILITLSIISYYYLIYPFKIQKQITKTPNLSLSHI
ncbi:stage II sporulation protein M [Algibacter amylolyticus]|uniref:Stage II sporulation protein M n=1 Tax=Algibacter amylolyticus TaxID=1608400 RepID=A0A5M7B0Y4_9FLAO|nr:stage II sporulation protein M [Algibacter amylolyticus]KAA5823353.1 stage II sporulation protein M [Algibacter amylolyticus]MBB5267497.1 putative membrane protein SpoIIM required for sporulation [Algibacter amylolyticus]TSJ73841.1 stage II sporulation protein M [Algibacter amylolyticus]